MQVISDYSLLHLLLAMMAHVNDLFNYFKQLVCKEDLLNFEFNCYYCHRQNFTILGIFLYCLHFLKLKLSLILSFYLPLIFKKMKLNLNYSLMDLLKNFVIIFKNFPVGYLFKLKDVLNSVHLFSFIKSVTCWKQKALLFVLLTCQVLANLLMNLFWILIILMTYSSDIFYSSDDVFILFLWHCY